jgi:hydrogenase maturation factor
MTPERSGEAPAGSGHPDACDEGVGCVTCGDVATPLRVLSVDADEQAALCADEADRAHVVDVGLIPDATQGDVLLVHAGAALARLDAEREPRL